MNSYQPRRRIRAERNVFKRRSARVRLRHQQRRGRFFFAMLKRRRYWLARKKMRGHPDMTLAQGRLAALLHDVKMA